MIYYKYLDIDKIYMHNPNIFEKSKFWMSSYKYLNDPLEDFNCIVFDGDEINWKCLIRQYLFSYIMYMRTYEIDSVKVIYSLYPKNKVYFKQIRKCIEKILKDSNTIYLCNCLSKKKTYITEVKLWFRCFTSYWLKQIIKDFSSFSKDEKKLLYEISISDIDYIDKVIHNKKHKTIDDKLHEIEWNDYYIDYKIDNKLNIFSFYEYFFNEIVKNMIPNYMIYSLSERYNSHLMWSHYANSHKGICLEYEINNVYNFIKEVDIKQYFYRKVRYSNTVFQINFFSHNIQFLNKSIRENYHILSKEYKSEFIRNYSEKEYKDELRTIFNLKLSTKGLDWKYENEMRIIYSVTDISDKEKGKLVKYNNRALKSITFGTLTSKKDIVKVCRTFKDLISNGLKVYQCFYKYNEKSVGYLLKRTRIKKNVLLNLIK